MRMTLVFMQPCIEHTSLAVLAYSSPDSKSASKLEQRLKLTGLGRLGCKGQACRGSAISSIQLCWQWLLSQRQGSR